MSGHTIVLEQTSTATVDRVWSVLTDLAGAAEVLSGVQRIEVLSPGPYAVGTTWRETRSMMGKSETQEMTVAVVQPPNRTVVTAEAAGVHYTTEFTLRSIGNGSLIRMEFSGEQPEASLASKITWAVFGRLGAMITKRVMAADLRDIAAAAEST